MSEQDERFHSAWWEIRDDDDDDAGPYWYGYCEGDKDGDRLGDGEPLKMDPRHFPVGTRIDVEEPWDEEFYAKLYEQRGKSEPPTEGELIAALKAAESALLICHRDLVEWRQFARFNAAGILCGEQVGIPEIPQRPTIAGMNVTNQNIGMVEEVLTSIRKVLNP